MFSCGARVTRKQVPVYPVLPVTAEDVLPTLRPKAVLAVKYLHPFMYQLYMYQHTFANRISCKLLSDYLGG